MRKKKLLSLIIFFLLSSASFSQDIEDLELLDTQDSKLLLEDEDSKTSLDLSALEEEDDLQSLKDDIAVDAVELDLKKADNKPKKKPQEGVIDPDLIIDESVKVINDELKDGLKGSAKPEIFDIGSEEKNLLDIAKYVEGRIPENEWDEIATAAKIDRYVVQEGDWLWKISQRLFGSGFYYSKIWSLNPQITNPHEIEPGMILLFDTGDANEMPDVKLSEFNDNPLADAKGNIDGVKYFDFKKFGDDVEPAWIGERQKLIKDGIYFQYASEETYQDLAEIGKQNLKTEYKKYEPVIPDIKIVEPEETYDSGSFEKVDMSSQDFKEGFFLNTFVTTNIVQDLGFVDSFRDERVYAQKYSFIYIKFDNSVKVKPGDMFSVYRSNGKTSNPISDRVGYRYTITGQVKAIRKINDLWECEITDLTGYLARKDRLTVYTPRISKIIRTFSKRSIEAAIIQSFNNTQMVSFGDVVYIDRGRADGVEMGTVFSVYDFFDRGTEKRITPDPTYKIGELTVITLTDNFATALVSNSSNDIRVGHLAFTKSEEDAARTTKVRNKALLSDVSKIEAKALEELDVELNVDDLSDDLLREADKIQLTEDELEELERQEREKSIIKDHERDLRELEKLEKEISEAESALNEARVDEDKFLEQQDLDQLERKKPKDPNAFESLNEIEKEVGRKYMDEDINARENPYGLTEFDLEEIDELLNTESL